MKEMKTFFTLCKYTFKFQTNITFMLIFLGIGVVTEVVSKGTQYLGGFYIVLCSMYMFQFIMSLSMSDMIQSSGLGRRIQLDIPVKLNVFLSVVLFTALIIFRSFMASRYPDKAHDIAVSLFMIDVLIFQLFIYTAVVYKYFLASIIVFCTAIAFLTAGLTFVTNLDLFQGLELSTSIILGYALIVIGAVLQYIICRALIKKPISQRAFRGIFKDAK